MMFHYSLLAKLNTSQKFETIGEIANKIFLITFEAREIANAPALIELAKKSQLLMQSYYSEYDKLAIKLENAIDFLNAIPNENPHKEKAVSLQDQLANLKQKVENNRLTKLQLQTYDTIARIRRKASIISNATGAPEVHDKIANIQSLYKNSEISETKVVSRLKKLFKKHNIPFTSNTDFGDLLLNLETTILLES